MTRTVGWIDRLRIERIVWTLDQRLYDLPRRSRIAKRREVRENLLTAAHDIGTPAALRHLGNGRRLAAEYLSAEFGDGPRHSWTAAAVFATGTPLLFNWMFGETSSAFGDGISAATPNATGTFMWSGIQYVQNDVTFHFADGHLTSMVGGAWGPLSWITWLVGTIVVGRLWRLLPSRTVREENTTAS
jgi:hypothetical protein